MSVKRDYKSAGTWHSKRDTKLLQARRRGLLVLVLAVVAAAGAGTGYYQNHYREAAVATDIAAAAPHITLSETNRPISINIERSSPPKPKYDFYDLSDQEPVIVETRDRTVRQGAPDPEAPVTAKIVNLSTAPSPPVTPHASRGNSGFIVQAGLFSTHSNADRIKAKIAMLGLQASIQTSVTADGKTLKRVQLGPFSSAAQAQAMLQQLQKNGIEAITVSLE